MKSFKDIVNYRRAVRKFDPTFPYDYSIVRQCLELATLAPNSSNMQLWEFHRVITPDKLKLMKECCLGQNAAKTANELVVFVTAPQKWQQQAERNAAVIRKAFAGKENVPQHVFDYYEKDMFLLYGGKGLTKYKGLDGDNGNERRKQDVRVILNKSVALAAMTFMYAMSEAGYDTCPMEGFEEDKIKDLLKLPKEAEVCMVISCGKRLPEGVYGHRLRIDNNNVIFDH